MVRTLQAATAGFSICRSDGGADDDLRPLDSKIGDVWYEGYSAVNDKAAQAVLAAKVNELVAGLIDAPGVPEPTRETAPVWALGVDWSRCELGGTGAGEHMCRGRRTFGWSGPTYRNTCGSGVTARTSSAQLGTS